MLTSMGRTILAAGAAITLSLGAAVAVYLKERDGLLAGAEPVVALEADTVAREISAFFNEARIVPVLLERAELDQLPRPLARRVFFAAAAGPVLNGQELTGLFVGFGDGGFWQFTELLPGALTAEAASWAAEDGVRREIDPEAGTAAWSIRTRDSTRWSPIPDASGYDPRTRPWYAGATTRQGAYWTAPYRFASSGEEGITYAEPILDLEGRIWAVLGMDITLTRFAGGLERAVTGRLPPGSAVAILPLEGGRPGGVLAEGTPLAQAVNGTVPADWQDQLRRGLAGDARTAVLPGRDHIVALAPVADDLRFPYAVAMLYPTDAIIGPAERQLQRSLALLAAVAAILSVIAVYALKLRREVRARRAAEAELTAANRDLELARDEAEAATRAKSSFLAMMSHEIRTPMNGVMAMAEMLDQTDLSDDQRDMSGVIRGSAAALLTIINDILDFSKIEAGKLDIEAIPFDPLDLMEAVGELLAPKAEEKGIVLTLEPGTQLPGALTGDPTRLRQVLLNLGGNAVKFTDEGAVTIRALPLPPQADGTPVWRFEVVDTGIGLTKEQQGRLFQAFQQADTSTTRKFGGTGLGLVICQRLIEMMGGRIGVTSALGDGSTFWFEVPLPVDKAEPRRPAFAVEGLSVLAVDVPARREKALSDHLAAAGIAEATFLPAELLSVERLEELKPTLVLMNVEGDGDQAFVLRQTVGRKALGAEWALVCPRRLASTMNAAEAEGYFARMTHPLRRERLWNVIGAAAGRVPLDERRGPVGDEFSGWAPPDAAEAEAAGALILVAEDNETNQTVIRRVLTDMGLAHDIMDNGRLALDALAVRRYGLLLTDFHMPEMDGFQLTAAVRGAEAAGGPRIPIVALTADALPGTAQRCADAGMDGYLTKPIDRKALAAEVAKHLPMALELRRRGAAPKPAGKAKAAEANAALARIEVDPAIFDLAHFTGTFGAVDAASLEVLTGFIGQAGALSAKTEAALEAGDGTAARDAAHALKGAARSLGAVRLGQLASDIQDALDEGEMETAAFLAGMLTMTVEELDGAVRPLTAG